MSRNKGKIFLCLLLIVCMLPLMGSALLDPSKRSGERQYKTAEVQPGVFEKNVGAGASAYYPVSVDVRCEKNNNRVGEITAGRKATLAAGTPLGTLYYDGSTANLESEKLSLTRMREAYSEECTKREKALDEARIALAELHGTDKEIAQLEIRKMEIGLDDYRLSQERSIRQSEENIAEMEEALGSTLLTAPVDGTITYYAYLNKGDSLYNNQLLLTLQLDSIVLLRIEDEMHVWRYGMPVVINYGPKNNRKTSTGHVISAANVLKYTEQSKYAYIAIDEEDLDPSGLTALSVTGKQLYLEDVLLIPRQCFKLEQGKYKVSIVDGNTIANRYINVAVTTSGNCLVLQGLTPGQMLIMD